MPKELKKIWVEPTPITPAVERELSAYSPLLRTLLWNRGVTTRAEAELYLDGGSDSGWMGAPVWQLKGMAEAVDRILFALEHEESIAVYGDYDVDGVTATALLTEALNAMGGKAQSYIPNRFDEGYGLNNDALTHLHEMGVNLVITVDCGIRSPREAEHARSLGMDMIISDHHSPGTHLPDCAAVICPKQSGDLYPYKELAGVGLAFKIVLGLLEKRPVQNANLDEWLQLVALGTVADVAPLNGENRLLVRAGLQALGRSRRTGICSLMGVAGVKPPAVSAEQIGFTLGPRLNAAGRMDSALDALELLRIGTDVDMEQTLRAGYLAQMLDSRNRERQQLTREISALAEASYMDGGDDLLIFSTVTDEKSAGVVGLAASRLVNLFYRPAIVGHDDGETTRASCRSIPEFNITQALDECKELLVRHGGHFVAAGFTVRNENRDELRSRLMAIARRELGERELLPQLRYDMELPLNELRPSMLPDLDRLQPTGQANPEAVFASRQVRVAGARTVGSDSSHLKLKVTDGRITWDAIAFRMGHLAGQMPTTIDILYTFERNVYNGQVGMQLNIKDIQMHA